MRKFWMVLVVLMVALPAFAAEVTLQWTAPTANEDGSVLTDLAGFKIYYGPSEGNYPVTVDVADPAATSITFALPAGTHTFVATAYNAAGIESVYSNSVTKEITNTPAPPINLNFAP